MHVSGAAAEVAAAGPGGRHANGGQRAAEYSAVNVDERDDRYANGGQQIAVRSPVKPGDGSAAHGSTTEHAVVGFAFNAISTVFVMLMATCAKLAGQHGLPVFEIVLARSSTLLVVALVTVIIRREDPRGNHRWLLLGRSLCGFCGICLWYAALLLLPLSDTVVFGFLTPLIVALLSPLLVKEHPSWMVLAMTPVCIIGVILCLKPPFIFGGKQRLDTAGVAAAISQAFVGSLVKLSVRELRHTDHPNVIILWLGTISTTGATAACVLVPGQWVTPKTFPQIALLAATGLTAYLFQFTMTLGLRRMKAAPSAAISYLSVVWGALAGIFIFHEYPTPLSVFGAIVICLGTMAVVVSEGWQQHRQRALDKGPADAAGSASEDEEAQLLAVELTASKGVAATEQERGARANGQNSASASNGSVVSEWKHGVTNGHR